MSQQQFRVVPVRRGGGSLTLFDEGPVVDKQGALGKRTYTGFNARWDAQEKEREASA